MRHRRDNTHKAIKAGLLKAGFSVADTSQVGENFPDFVIGKYGVDAKVECKTPVSRTQKAQERLTDGQATFADTWKGTAVIAAYSVEDALYGFQMLLKRQGWVK